MMWVGGGILALLCPLCFWLGWVAGRHMWQSSGASDTDLERMLLEEMIDSRGSKPYPGQFKSMRTADLQAHKAKLSDNAARRVAEELSRRHTSEPKTIEPKVEIERQRFPH
jgi:hypothetical protein